MRRGSHGFFLRLAHQPSLIKQEKRMPLHYTFTRLLVDDVATTLAFYRDVLSFTVGYSDEVNYADLDTGGVTLALFRREAQEQAIATGDATRNLASRDQVSLIFAVEQVEATYRELSAKGVTFVTAPTDFPEWGIRAAHFRDPAGTLIEVNQPL
jgi:predicted enzyme related to lactoylglutathione lyase